MNPPDLRTALIDRLDAVQPPHGDITRARDQGRSIRRRRRGIAAGAAAAAVAAIVAGVAVLPDGVDPGGDRVEDEYAALGPLDFTDGARAYAGDEIHLGGRTFPWDDAFTYFDTDAAATPYGIVFYDTGRPMLLDETGQVSALVDGPVGESRKFHPTAKPDALQPLVAWATLRDGAATITVRDMTTGDVASTDVDCGGCGKLVIDGIDDGVVFVRDGDGTRTWDSATGEWREFAGPRTRVADVRNGVVLYDGPAPTSPGDRRLVKGAIDAQLSFDGEYVLYWSTTLESTTGGPPAQLEQKGDFVTFDTDGSVLVAAPARRSGYVVYDCELPTGRCAELGPLRATSGDPMFIGDDM